MSTPKMKNILANLKKKGKACFNSKENQNEPTDDKKKKKSSKLLTTKYMKNSSGQAGIASSKDKAP